MNPIIVFAGATGLNTVADPVRVPFQKNGITDLQAAVNVSIDKTLRVNRRRGLNLLQAGSYHSLFCDGGDAFVCSAAGAIYRIGPDLSLQGVRSGLTAGARVSFVQVGDYTYYANGHERGRIKDGVSYAWAEGTYTGPTTNRQFFGPMSGHHLAWAFSRMFIAEDNAVWWSEPYNNDLFNLAESFAPFNTKVLMVKPVDDGLFVSTSKNTYFLAGKKPREFVAQKVAPYPAIEWSDATAYVPGADVGLKDPRLCALWASPEGAILGTAGGSIINLNKDKIVYPETGQKGFGCLIGYNFIHGLE